MLGAGSGKGLAPIVLVGRVIGWLRTPMGWVGAEVRDEFSGLE